jgi:hypothetical protein
LFLYVEVGFVLMSLNMVHFLSSWRFLLPLHVRSWSSIFPESEIMFSALELVRFHSACFIVDTECVVPTVILGIYCCLIKIILLYLTSRQPLEMNMDRRLTRESQNLVTFSRSTTLEWAAPSHLYKYMQGSQSFPKTRRRKRL